MNKLNTFTSTGSKLIHHPEVVNALQRQKIGTPVVLQVAPTSKCNLNCCFCSNVNRKKHESLEFDFLKDVIEYLCFRGLRSIEITGGGDPTLYLYINQLIELARERNLECALITNGIALKEKVTQDNLDYLTWARVSLNSLDYVDDLDLPEIKGTLGFSYVINEKTELDYDESGDIEIKKISDFVKRNNAEYVRIVPDCQTTIEKQEENNRLLSEVIGALGHPYFYQPKRFEKPKRCWWGYFKPFLLHDGYIYPCSSVVLNDSADRYFNEKFRWIHAEYIHDIYEHPVKSFENDACTHCVFTGQNNLVDSIINPSGMEGFI